MITIITIEREYGCGGGEIAQKLASRLGWKLWDQLVTCEIARLTHCDQSEVEGREERVDSLYYRLLKALLRGSFEGNLNMEHLKMLDGDSIFQATEQIVHKVALAGNCVIVGRGSQYFLSQRSNTLRIFLFAPKKNKIERLKTQGLSEEDAANAVATVDRERAAFVDRYFHLRWPDRCLYHAMLNTALGADVVVREILSLKQVLEASVEPAEANPVSK